VTRRVRLASALLSGLLGVAAVASAQQAAPKLEATPPTIGAAPSLKLPPVQERRLANGLRVLYLPNTEQPVVSMSVMIRSGAASEPAAKAGLAGMTAGLLDQGTATRSATDIANTIDSAGGSLSATASWDATTASTTVLADRAGLAAELLSDVLRNPVFKNEEIERARTQALSGLQLSRSDAGEVADDVFDAIVYGGSPYAHPIQGTAETIRALTRDDFVAFHKAQYLPNNATLAIVGDLTAQQAFDLAEKHFGAWAKGDVAAAPKAWTPTPGKVRVVVLDKPDAAQTEIRVGAAGFARNDPDYFAGIVTNTILGGAPFSSRIENELRVKRGLTYGAGSQFETRLLGGAFQIETNTKTATTVEALDVILQQVSGLRGGDVTADELNARKGFLTGVFLLALETPEAVAGRLLQAELYGLGPDYLGTYTKKVEAITSADVRRIAEQRIRPDQFVVVLAGNAKEFVEGVKKFGPVEVIPFDQVDTTSATLRKAAATTGAAAPVSEADAAAAMALAQKTLAALGGDAFANQKSMVVKATGTLAPSPGQTLPINSITTYTVYPDDSYSEADLGVARITLGSNATESWLVLPTGIQDTTAQTKVERKHGIDVLRRLGSGGLTARPAADADVNGVAAKGFVLRDAEGNETTFYVDPATSLPVKIAYQTDVKTEVVLKDYRSVLGIQVPYAIEQFRDGAKYLELLYSDAQVNVDVDPKLFVKPQ
jgi:zinc protease